MVVGEGLGFGFCGFVCKVFWDGWMYGGEGV